MTDQGTNKTGFARDDQLKREIHDELRATRAVTGEEVFEPEPTGADREIAQAARTVPDTGIPSGMTPEGVTVRNELARHLDRNIYPARRSSLLGSLHRHQAPDPLVERVAALPPDERYPNVQAVVKALGYGVEDRRV
ncbi:DUF2795 domain-containing protein [Actinacidiphila acididurans]|uniref:DUF2795 domain-containing protein n=1 Tax=Actinacidiphila acididurans TaxID=2784346 RepID=A0ABS2TJ91_9ACTN|nr:DUF2795 domain-containing protein [Actinacidiphila acididurans]MBM9503410.1 DUF2795 domain-containing protein [Actinacidiphila acididurans]